MSTPPNIRHYRGSERCGSKLAQRRRLRRNATPSEQLLWSHLRNRAMCCLKFRRQHQFGPYILDFYCPQLRLAIEVDGPAHYKASARRHDARRDLYLENAGVATFRIDSDRVLNDTTAILEAILGAIIDRMEKI